MEKKAAERKSSTQKYTPHSPRESRRRVEKKVSGFKYRLESPHLEIIFLGFPGFFVIIFNFFFFNFPIEDRKRKGKGNKKRRKSVEGKKREKKKKKKREKNERILDEKQQCRIRFSVFLLLSFLFLSLFFSLFFSFFFSLLFQEKTRNSLWLPQASFLLLITFFLISFSSLVAISNFFLFFPELGKKKFIRIPWIPARH